MKHVTVLLDEAIEGLDIKPDGIYVDATMGGGGHSEEICKRLGPNGLFIGIDQDDYAHQVAKDRLKDYKCKKILVKNNFSNLKEILQENEISQIDGIIFDLGVSSFQFDDGKLDMRMNQDQDFSAFNIINEYSKDELIKIFREYGEEKFAKRIAENIVKVRKNQPIEGTLELSEIIKQSYPAKLRFKGKHPARKVFQALRIEVNKELSILPETLEQAVEALRPEGRLAVISFHSLEDRIVKQFIRKEEKPGQDLDIPYYAKQPEPVLKRINRKPIVPSPEEVQENNRSRSAKLRIAEKI